MRSFVDWGILADTETRGRYVAAESPRLDVAHQGLDTEVVMLRMPT